MIRCNNCGANNIDGSEYCDECGTRLTVAEAPPARQPYTPPAQFVTQSAPPPPPSFTKDNVTPKPATPYTPPPPPAKPSSGIPADRAAGRSADRVKDQTPNRAADPAMNPKPSSAAPPAASQAANFPTPPDIVEADVNRTQGAGPAPNQTSAFNGQTNALRGGSDAEGARRQVVSGENAGRPTGAKLIIQRGGKVGKEFPITGAEALIGRWDADGGIFPDVDLDQDDPEAKVSRRHARIQFLNNQYLIEDLGSTNGTFVNRGPRLAAGAKQSLKNGDEIIVGKTFLKFVLD
jgi:FHA domain